MKVLYISYDGMTDPLGQSQVIPYLISLAKSGYKISLISFEKETAYQKGKNNMESLLEINKIKWIPLKYTKQPPIFSTLWDIIKLKRVVFKLYQKDVFDIVHCRSYISALIGLKCKKRFNSFFIFDMRGFWADERVDGKIWNLINPLFSLIYGYFKRKERRFLIEADHIVVLTHAAKKIIISWFDFEFPEKNITVIPCSVDMELFNYKNISESDLIQKRKELKIETHDFIISYVGSIGTWYMLPEMLSFFKVLKQKKPSAKFLFITKDNPNRIYAEGIKKGVNKEGIIIKASERQEIPLYLALCNASIFFIKPCFSKQASSPTKQGELMSMGIPIICNAGIGDTDLIINEADSGILLKNFTENNFQYVIAKIDEAIIVEKEKTRSVASKYYDLDKASIAYLKIYKLANRN